jgi:hypothetical protein
MIAQREVPGGGIEPPTRGFSVPIGDQAISHHFQPLTDQGLPGAMLGYVGFCLVIFGCGGYNLVTITSLLEGPWSKTVFGPSFVTPWIHPEGK